MRSRARRVLRPLAIVAVLIGFVVPTLAPVHAIWETDRDCGPVTVGADHQTSHFEVVLPPVADEHCALCHWLRSIGGAAPSAALVAMPGLVAQRTEALLQDRRLVDGPTLHVPSRGPPPSLSCDAVS